MFVTSWKNFYESRKVNYPLSFKAEPNNLYFAQIPNYDSTVSFESMVQHNLARVYRHFVTQRSKAYMSPYCYQGTANPFLRNKIVQIYHNAFEPVEIPCYTCDPRMIQDGRPKMWFTVDNRNSYDSYEGLILRANFTAQHIFHYLQAFKETQDYRVYSHRRSVGRESHIHCPLRPMTVRKSINRLTDAYGSWVDSTRIMHGVKLPSQRVYVVVGHHKFLKRRHPYAEHVPRCRNDDNPAVLMQQLPYKATSWGPEWQMDQTAGENIMNRPGGSLFINPVRGDDIYVSEYTQTGMFFCASVDPEKEGMFMYPDDFVQNSVMINVDVIMSPDFAHMGFERHYESSPQLYDPSKRIACTTDDRDINIECVLSWQPWSCPKVCEYAESSKQVTRSRMGYVSFKKRDVLKPIGIDCHKLIRIFLPFCLGLDAILSVHPYDTQGIPVYSSYWRDKTTELHNSILNRFKIPLQTEYMDVKIVTCEEMAECENVPGYREEVTMAPLVHTETAPPVTETPKMSTECPKDLFKHTDVFVPKKTSFVQLYKGKSYRFYCGQTVNENQKSKVFWRLGASRNSAPHCSSSSPFFQEKNELHVHDASQSELYACDLEHQGKNILYGKIVVTYVEPIDWHASVLAAVGIGLLVLISCSACFWCGRGVKNVTKLVANTAIEGGVMAADFYLMGAAGQFMENRKAADQERERQILAKEDEMVHKAIDDALKKKRQKKVKE